MRQRQIRQIEQGIRLLGQAHKELKKQLEKHMPDAAGNLLEQCQQYAIELGQMIETEEGEGTEAVRLLEDYCEQIYQIYQGREQICPPGFPGKTYKRFRQLLIRLENEVRNHISVQREVVFLPYKASMWDSLESIWRAACSDPDCEAYVIPVPYYDKNPDGSLREMHYEGAMYPDDVPVTDYREYDFANRCPDMIFIHNPYDECNYVTSVHPFFYSKNLKQYTEQLIYVPYFILGEPDPDNEDAVEHISHFCTCPGVFYADKVIVQSEAMRQVYINVLMKFMADYGYERKDLEKKILGLGSPKVDRVLSYKKEDMEIPDDWKKKIQKTDGSWKKIVLYNTSVNAFLQNSDKMLKKMEEVFKTFKNEKEEIVLLWRPHPLMQATIKSMRPQLWGVYQNIIEQYQKEDWGIYDDTPDLDRAVVLCDAYYGDPSSVVQLCEKTGKAVMIQKIEAAALEQGMESSGKPLAFENLYDDGTYFWFTENNYNALFRMDKKNCRTELIGIFPDEDFLQERQYTFTVKLHERLYFAPYSANEIAEYDLQKKKFKKISVLMPDKNNGFSWKKHKFIRAVVIKEKIYFIPWHYPGILCYDPRTNLSVCFDDWVEEIEKLRVSDWGYFNGIETDGSYLFLSCICAGAIVIFDTEEQKSRIIQTPEVEGTCKYCGISKAKSEFYLLSADGSMWKRKLDSEKEKVSRIRLPKCETEAIAFYPICSTSTYIYLYPFGKGKGYRIDTRTDQVIPVEAFDVSEKSDGKQCSFLAVSADKEKMYVMTGNTHRFVKYDLFSGNKYEQYLFLTKKDQYILEEIKKKEYKERFRIETIMEPEEESLRIMLILLQSCNGLQRKNMQCNHERIGTEIYRVLIKEQEYM